MSDKKNENRTHLWQKGILGGWLLTLFFFAVGADSPPVDSCCLEEPDELVVFNPSFARMKLNSDKNFDVRLKSGREATFLLGGVTGYFVRTANVVSSLNNLTVFMKTLEEISSGARARIAEWNAMSEAERAEWQREKTGYELMSLLIFGGTLIAYPPTDNVITVKANYPAVGEKKAGTTRGSLVVETEIKMEDLSN